MLTGSLSQGGGVGGLPANASVAMAWTAPVHTDWAPVHTDWAPPGTTFVGVDQLHVGSPPGSWGAEPASTQLVEPHDYTNPAMVVMTNLALVGAVPFVLPYIAISIMAPIAIDAIAQLSDILRSLQRQDPFVAHVAGVMAEHAAASNVTQVWYDSVPLLLLHTPAFNKAVDVADVRAALRMVRIGTGLLTSTALALSAGPFVVKAGLYFVTILGSSPVIATTLVTTGTTVAVNWYSSRSYVDLFLIADGVEIAIRGALPTALSIADTIGGPIADRLFRLDRIERAAHETNELLLKAKKDPLTAFQVDIYWRAHTEARSHIRFGSPQSQARYDQISKLRTAKDVIPWLLELELDGGGGGVDTQTKIAAAISLVLTANATGGPVEEQIKDLMSNLVFVDEVPAPAPVRSDPAAPSGDTFAKTLLYKATNKIIMDAAMLCFDKGGGTLEFVEETYKAMFDWVYAYRLPLRTAQFVWENQETVRSWIGWIASGAMTAIVAMTGLRLSRLEKDIAAGLAKKSYEPLPADVRLALHQVDHPDATEAPLARMPDPTFQTIRQQVLAFVVDNLTQTANPPSRYTPFQRAVSEQDDLPLLALLLASSSL
jgi:hypothetical protein